MNSPSFFLEADFNFGALYSPLAVPDEPHISAESQPHSEPEHQVIQRSRPRASLACVSCRARHLKCDAKQVCSRCKADDRNCLYAKSRRGGKRKRSSFSAAPDLDGRSSTARTVHGSLPHAGPHMSEKQKDVQFLDLYYEHFHDSHPIALPQWSLESHLDANARDLEHVVPVLEFIGSIYEPDGEYLMLRQAAYDSLSGPGALPYNGFSVQALLLFAIAMHCSDEYEAGDLLLDQAIDMALSIQMNRQGFARANGEGDPVLEESWRRTYWMLFLIDGLFAAINHRATHRLQKVSADVDLPCEDHYYETGIIPEPRTLSEYDNRELDADEILFSSFTYLVDAGRILSSVLGINQDLKCPSDRKLLTADAKIAAWFLYLPKSKQVVLGEEHMVDELMFLAHLCINTEKLLLHRPYSQLLHSSIEADSKCTPIYSEKPSKDIQRSVRVHTAMSLEAIEAAMKLLVLPSPHLKHSPIFTCSLALAIMAQVSACNHVLEQSSSDYLAGRERVRLGLGVLRTHERHWGLARRSMREVKGIAKQLLSTTLPIENKGIENRNSASVPHIQVHLSGPADATNLLKEHFTELEYGLLDKFC